MRQSFLLASAVAYARAGMAVVPLYWPTSAASCSCGRVCGSVGKHPMPAHGLWEASTDVRQVRRWWRRWPEANVGIRTGELVDVCDIDSAEGLAAVLAVIGAAGVTGPVVRTGSGGWHVYVAATGHGNRVGFLPGVDWRGIGGFVVAPPSRHVCGGSYRWVRDLTCAVPACPAALATLLAPPAARPGLSSPVRQPGRYAAAALAEEARRVAEAAAGTRNDTLNRAAYALGQLVGAGLLEETTVTTALTVAARSAGLGVRETANTIRSGLSAGIRSPRGVA